MRDGTRRSVRLAYDRKRAPQLLRRARRGRADAHCQSGATEHRADHQDPACDASRKEALLPPSHDPPRLPRALPNPFTAPEGGDRPPFRARVSPDERHDRCATHVESLRRRATTDARNSLHPDAPKRIQDAGEDQGGANGVR